ncbi:hypothetical protein LCGC14_0704610 [marine sediment metagenome]|uniref:Uncharacterized protein n=1 Tax=marine sediment metagenome TaxID=412755 RepID=A0A0F9QLL6_9ZZZZ
MNVWITHYIDRFPLKTAVKFLEPDNTFKKIFKGNINSSQPQKYLPKIKETVDLMEKEDFLLIAGSSVLSLMWCSIFYKRFGHLNLLIWDAVEQKYVKRSVS